MQIAPPFGYKEVVPFLKTRKVRLLGPGEVPEFVQNGNAIPISLSEFQPVARDYPIVFTGGVGATEFTPVAVLGLSSGENLFYENDSWVSGVYIPAYARRYPFCMAKVNVNQVEPRTVVVQAGAYAEHQFLAVEGGGRETAVNDSRLAVRLGPGCGERLKVRMARHVNRPTMTFPWDR